MRERMKCPNCGQTLYGFEHSELQVNIFNGIWTWKCNYCGCKWTCDRHRNNLKVTKKGKKLNKVFVATFSRSSNGAVQYLVDRLKAKKMYTDWKEADYILACGDRAELFDFILERYRENRKIIHLWAGEISQGTHDEVYRHSITLMSMLQLCTNQNAVERVKSLCKSVDKEPNAYSIGNVMLDDLNVDESYVPKHPYDLILYNPPTLLSQREIIMELDEIRNKLIENYIWIRPNNDKGKELVFPYCTHPNQSRHIFLGLLKNCNRFITNSSSQYYEATQFLKPEQIIPVGTRNINRESKHSDMTTTGASENIIKILEKL